MKPLTYKIIKETPGEYVIQYQETDTRNKQIQFSFLEHYLCFVDLLKQAKYKQVTSK